MAIKVECDACGKELTDDFFDGSLSASATLRSDTEGRPMRPDKYKGFQCCKTLGCMRIAMDKAAAKLIPAFIAEACEAEANKDE